ncbi:MAG TPA: EamA family transporter [Stellaceae bacterium]|nr:EamA family transporter [Stellaceae bacterium]
MGAAEVAAALLSALLHAGWNAAIKASARPGQAMAAQMLASAVLVLPALLWTGPPPPATWIWIAASTLMNLVTVTALLRAYELGGFGVVYPVVRAVSVLLVVPLAAALADERLGDAAIAGVGMIALSLGLLAHGARRDRAFTLGALAWTGAAGLSTATYVICDAHGVRLAGSPWAYGFAVSVTNAVAMYARHHRAGTPWRLMRTNAALAGAAAVASVASYLLILWVWTRAPIAPASALRDTSAVFALLIAIAWLREPFTLSRMLAVLLAAAAVPLLRLA